MSWSAADIPDQSGRTVLVTGATSGLGLVTATELARHGARVLLGARNPARGEQALAQVQAAAGGAAPELVDLDLADLTSVRRSASDVLERTGGELDVLVNNAGLMAPPLSTTVDGFELQWATNHLGHAALTWLLLPALTERRDARVVTVTSLAERLGRIDPSAPGTLVARTRGERYRAWSAYGLSKRANLLLTHLLHRDHGARVHGSGVTAVTAHPGASSTNLVSTMMTNAPQPVRALAGGATSLLGQSAAAGALPQLYAATAPDVTAGATYGPSGIGQLRGSPKQVRLSAGGHDDAAADLVRDLTVEQTGVAPPGA